MMREHEGSILVSTPDAGDGIGMGLAINRSIAEAHGGRLWRAPNHDRGEIFQLTPSVAPSVRA